jgi:hypothetical protein
VFHPGVQVQLKRQTWAVKPLISVLNQVGDKTVSIDDNTAAMQVSIDSGQAVYTYILMAQSK